MSLFCLLVPMRNVTFTEFLVQGALGVYPGVQFSNLSMILKSQLISLSPSDSGMGGGNHLMLSPQEYTPIWIL